MAQVRLEPGSRTGGVDLRSIATVLGFVAGVFLATVLVGERWVFYTLVLILVGMILARWREFSELAP